MYKNLSEMLSPAAAKQKQALAIYSAFLDEGYLPEPLTLTGSNGSIFIQALPKELCSFIRGERPDFGVRLGKKHEQREALTIDLSSEDLSPELIRVEVTLSGVDRIVKDLHVSDPLEANVQEVRNLTRQAMRRTHESASLLTEGTSLPSPWGADPLRYLPGHTPEGGDQVGPHHPMFGDPRYDPLGPGGLGEPDYDHQIPPPFGQAPRPRGPPRFPPPGGAQPGRFGGPRML